MSRYTKAWLILTLLLMAGCTGGSTLNATQDCPGYIVYQTWGEQKPKLVAISPDGREARRINLPDEGWGIQATQASNRVLYMTKDRNWFLVDTDRGTTRELVFPERGKAEVQPSYYQLGGGKRWIIFANTTFNQAYLINLEMGEVTYLNTTSEEIGSVRGGIFSPDESYLALTSHTGLWLAPTADLSKARRLTDEILAIPGGFSADNRKIIYSRGAANDQTEIVIEQVDGSGSDVVAVFDTPTGASWVPDKEKLLLTEEGQLSLLDLTDREPQALMDYEGIFHQMCFVLDGKKVVFGHVFNNTVNWTLIDLQTGMLQALDELQGYSEALYRGLTQRWVIFVDITRNSDTRGRIASLDTETGQVEPLFSLGTDTEERIGFYSTSPDGHLGLVDVWDSDGSKRMWLLKAATGQALQLPEGSSESSFSPNGRCIVVSRFEDNENLVSEPMLILVGTDAAKVQPLVKGWHPVWVSP